jgi:hypothetical protein
MAIKINGTTVISDSQAITSSSTISAAGNVTAGNVTTSGQLTINSVAVTVVGGNLTVGGNTVITASSTGTSSATGNVNISGNVTGGNILTGGIVSATGNISGANVIITGGIFDTGALSITTGSNGNIALTPNGTGIVTASSAISATGAITGAAITGSSLTVSTGSVTAGSIINANANGVGNIGSSSTYFNTVFAKATSAQYADLAEKYEADAEYAPGTVLEFGGSKEVTVSVEAGSTRVAGVVSTNPSYIMNAGLSAEHVAMVALQGRVPCRVVGPVAKGDMMVSAGNGSARVDNSARAGTIIGKSLENFDGAEGTIEVVIGRN